MTQRQEFQDCTHGLSFELAILTSDYGDYAVHRSVVYFSVARELSKEFGLPGFWRLKKRKS